MTTLAWLVQKSPLVAKVPQEMARWDAVCRQLRGFRWGTAQNSIAAIYCVSCSVAIWRAEGKHSILVCRVCIPGAGWCIPDAWSFCVHAWANGPFPHWTTHSRIISSLSPSVCGSGCATSLEAFVEALLQDVILHPADQVWNEAERLFLSFSRYHATNLRTGLHVGKHGCPWNAIGSRHRILAHVIRDSANLLHVGLVALSLFGGEHRCNCCWAGASRPDGSTFQCGPNCRCSSFLEALVMKCFIWWIFSSM